MTDSHLGKRDSRPKWERDSFLTSLVLLKQRKSDSTHASGHNACSNMSFAFETERKQGPYLRWNLPQNLELASWIFRDEGKKRFNENGEMGSLSPASTMETVGFLQVECSAFFQHVASISLHSELAEGCRLHVKRGWPFRMYILGLHSIT